MALYFIYIQQNLKPSDMKIVTTKKTTAETNALLKAIDLELKAILEDDVRKLQNAEDIRIKEAAFLQLIAA